MRSSEDKSIELSNNDTEEELPSFPHLPLLRQRAGIFSDTPVAIYLVKQSGELLIDYGHYVDPLENMPNMTNLGNNPIPCFPVNRREAFQSELKNACLAFFQRPVVREILKETISIPKELIEIIVKYR